ncbi:DUF6458 family protein [Hamadaea tsunoensis]|uniref:DUF6458 family protein n=1 Tax=Hamadaea tsunoensis TaxID=53368 RepID=UPI0003F6BAE8|nr:DUF6458 family protein [Hamadaea tsunoensis]
MGIGASIFLIALGAILTFALDVHVGWLDLDVVGWILMAAGAVGLILTMTVWNSRRTTRVVTQPAPNAYPAQPAEYEVEERRDIVPPRP